MADTLKKIAFLFPGQGAQYAGMGKDLWDSSPRVRELFDAAGKTTGIDIPGLLFEAGEDELKKTENTQVAITAVNLAVWSILDERGLAPQAVAGFSLGEFSALVAAGVIGTEAVFSLVKERGTIMAEVAASLAGDGDGPGMAAVMGLAPDRVEALCRDSGLELFAANFNSPDQTVVAGTHAALEKGKEYFTSAGAKRWIPLKVSGPFHSPLLADARKAFADVVAAVEYGDPRIALLSNVTGAVVDSGDEARRLSIEQVTSPVRWTAEEEAIATLGVDLCLETGPGKVLSGLWKKSGSDIPCLPAGTVAQIDAALAT